MIHRYTGICYTTLIQHSELSYTAKSSVFGIKYMFTCIADICNLQNGYLLCKHCMMFIIHTGK